jgi:hypothetical protein
MRGSKKICRRYFFGAKDQAFSIKMRKAFDKREKM